MVQLVIGVLLLRLFCLRVARQSAPAVVIRSIHHGAVVAGEPSPHAVDDPIPPTTLQLRDDLYDVALLEGQARAVVGDIVVERAHVELPLGRARIPVHGVGFVGGGASRCDRRGWRLQARRYAERACRCLNTHRRRMFEGSRAEWSGIQGLRLRTGMQAGPLRCCAAPAASADGFPYASPLLSSPRASRGPRASVSSRRAAIARGVMYSPAS